MRRFFVLPAVLGMGASLGMTGCTCVGRQPTPDELRQKTAQATEQLKQNTKAVVQGIREGLSQDKQLDLNSAGREQLSALPGISNRRADAIVAGRPYANPKDLVGKRILSKAEYERIADRVTVKK